MWCFSFCVLLYGQCRKRECIQLFNDILYWIVLPAVMAYAILGCCSMTFTSTVAVVVVIAIVYLAMTAVVSLYCLTCSRWQYFPDILLGAVRPNLFLYLIIAPYVVGENYIGAEFGIESVMCTLFTGIVLLVPCMFVSTRCKMSVRQGMKELFLIPVIFTIGVTGIWRVSGIPCPGKLLAAIGWIAAWCTPISITVILVVLTRTWRQMNLDTIGPTAVVVGLSLWIVPTLCLLLSELARQWGYIDGATRDRLSLLFAMACSTSAYVMIQKIRGQAIAYVNFVLIVTLISPVSVYLFVRNYF